MNKNKLLYIHTEDACERAQQRAERAQKMGFAVTRIINNEDFSPERRAAIFELLSDESCVGVWLDFDLKQLNPLTRQIALTAGDLDKGVVGMMRDEHIEPLLRVHVGTPELTSHE